MKKKKNENTGFPQRPAWLEYGEEGSAIQAKKILRNDLVAGIDPDEPQPLREFWNPVYMENISFNGVEQTKEDLFKALSESGYLIVTSDENDIRWAIDQLKKGEIVRNSAWPEEMTGIVIDINSHHSGNVKIINTKTGHSLKYNFTNEDVLFGTWEIVK